MATSVEIVLLSGVAAFDVYSFYKLKETEREYKEKQARQQQLKSQEFKYQEKQQDHSTLGSHTNVNVSTSSEKTDSQKKLEMETEPTVIRVEERPIEVEYPDKTPEYPVSSNSELDSRVFNLEKTLMTETHDRISRLEVRLDSLNDSIGSRLHELDSKISGMSGSPELLLKIENKLDEIDKRVKETNGNLEVVSMKLGLLEGRQEKFTDKIKNKLAKEHDSALKQRKKNKTAVLKINPIVKVVNAKPAVHKTKPKAKSTVVNVRPLLKVVNVKPIVQKKKETKNNVSKKKTVNTVSSKLREHKGEDVKVNVTVNK